MGSRWGPGFERDMKGKSVLFSLLRKLFFSYACEEFCGVLWSEKVYPECLHSVDHEKRAHLKNFNSQLLVKYPQSRRLLTSKSSTRLHELQ